MKLSNQKIKLNVNPGPDDFFFFIIYFPIDMIFFIEELNAVLCS